MEQMDKLFREMDSLKNDYFNRQFKSSVPLLVPGKMSL